MMSAKAKQLLTLQLGVVSRQQVFEMGVSPRSLQYRIRRGGPWQRLLPGVYLTSTGEPSHDQLIVAAALYAGEASLITGPAALRFYGIQGPDRQRIDVLVPASTRPASRDFVTIHRTRRMPTQWMPGFGCRYVLPPRAVADAVGSLASLADARALVASAVQRDQRLIGELAAELAGRRHKSDALLRQVLVEVADGIRSAPEGELRELIRASGLPEPMYNPELYLNGTFLARPDAWWPQASVAVEVDSVLFHTLPQDYHDTIERRRKMGAAGINVLPVSPHQLRTSEQEVLADIAAAISNGHPAPASITARSARSRDAGGVR
jgi:hypothetical protein